MPGFHFLMVWALPLSFIPLFFFFFFLVSFHHCPHLSWAPFSCLHLQNFLPTLLLLPPFPWSFVLCFLLFLFLSSSRTPHTLRSLASLGIGGNLERCRLMTAETCVGHSGLVSGNTTGIQTRTSDILFFLPYALMSSEQLQPRVIQF